MFLFCKMSQLDCWSPGERFTARDKLQPDEKRAIVIAIRLAIGKAAKMEKMFGKRKREKLLSRSS